MENIALLKVKDFASAVADFEKSMNIDETSFTADIADLINSGRIQKFEICAELLWKTVQAYLRDAHGVECSSPKSAIKAFYQNGKCSIDDYETMMQIIDERNRLSHLYKKNMILSVIENFPGYIQVFSRALGCLSGTAK